MTLPPKIAAPEPEIFPAVVVVPLMNKSSVAVIAPPNTAGEDEDSVPFTIVTDPWFTRDPVSVAPA